MENNENFVHETENVEQPTEEAVIEPAKLFTQEDMNAAVGKAKARERSKVEKQYKRQYGELVDVLKAGTGIESVEEMTGKFRGFYEEKGAKIPKKTEYSDSDIKYLAEKDANEIISGGFEDVVEEADRLNALGVENMTARDKAVFVALTNHIKATETSRELQKIGVTEDVINSKEFNDFRKKFSSNTPVTEVYDFYRKTQKKDVKPMGSMKNSVSAESGVKEFYTPEEARRFTKKDYDNNPKLYEAVKNSMFKWKR